MDRRTVLAIVLIIGVIFATPVLFPGKPRVAPPTATQDTTATAAPAAGAPAAVTPAQAPATVAPRANVVEDSTAQPAQAEPPHDVTLADSLSSTVFTTAGGALRTVTLPTYEALDKSGRKVTLSTGSSPLLSYRWFSGTDTVRFGDHVFAAEESANGTTFRGTLGPTGPTVEIRYTAVRDSMRLRVEGSVLGAGNAGAGGFLLIDLPSTFQSFEADSNSDHTALAYAVKSGTRNAEGVPFGSLDPGERKIIQGPVTWAVAKNKYFMVGLLPDSGNTQFGEAQITGGARTARTATVAHGTVVAQLGTTGRFAFDLYTGPQQYQRLRSLGRDFENSNPYGGFMQGVVQPFATIVMRVLLWMKATLGWSYGGLLVLFGVMVRLLMWPLNQGAMRTTIKMQRIQPELNALQQKYKGDPQKLQTEMMRVYKEHDMSPFSAFAGCLPILLPMPILFALFFVFQNTIEFRGVPFLWLADISLKDPYYIVPLLMGVSMFVLSWIGLRNSPPNPQAKMMAYVMPVMMTVLFANWASGLNLYYAVQNIAALPQQWLIANERGKASKAKG
ncbi:MAG: membrane protein insertase YidC [Gemmatimonadetes bacterium]|nr:membrane protein insertase YidC [Gemmatimonadota bacterium]